MKHSAKLMSLAMVLTVTTASEAQTPAQTPPAATPAQQQMQTGQQTQAQQQQSTHSRAKGAAAAPQLEPLPGMLPRARSSELGMPVVRRGERTGRPRHQRTRSKLGWVQLKTWCS
jgi:hypothetical protein